MSDLEKARAEIARLKAKIETVRGHLPESLRGKDVAHGVKLIAMGYASHDRRFWRYGYALRVAMQFVDRAAGEGIGFDADGDLPAMASNDVCERIADLIEMECGGPSWLQMLKPIPADAEASLASHPHTVTRQGEKP